MFRAVNLSVELTSLVGKFQQITRLRSRVQVTPVEPFQDYYFLRACYSIAPNGPVHEFKKKQKMKNKMKKEKERKAKRRKKRASEHNASGVLVVCCFDQQQMIFGSSHHHTVIFLNGKN